MAEHSEIEHWQLFIRGDKGAFKSLYDSFVDVLFSYATRFSTDQHIVQDAIHDLFVDLYRYRSGLNPEVNVRAYLFSSLRRKILSILEKNQNSTGPMIHEAMFQLEYNKEEQIIRDETENEILQKLHYELDKLADRQKEALYLRFSCEMAYEQIADVMNVSISSCRTLVYRAVKQLRLRMEDAPVTQLLLITFWQKS